MSARNVLPLFLLPGLMLGVAAAKPARVLRVCADPANLPFSNERGEGFENRLAELVADDLGAHVEYTWWAQRRGFLRNTLNAGKCDVVMSLPKGLDMARTTAPLYRSSFAFVARKDGAFAGIVSFDDPRLRTARIGVPLTGDDGANPAPVHVLSRRGIVDGVRGFPLYAEIGRSVPAAIEALDRGELDVAILWGPVAGPGARRAKTPLVVTPVREDADGDQPLAFTMAMGVRKDDAALARDLDAVIARRGGAIAKVLREAGVPTKEVRRAP